MGALAKALADLEQPAPHPADGPLQEPPYDDSPRRRGLRPSPVHQTEERIHVDEVQAMIQQHISDYLKEPMPGRALLLALPPGSGKTTALVHVAEDVASAGGRVLYAGPRHDLFTDLMQIANHPAWWYAWQPRHAGDEQRSATCRYAPQMDRWLHRGYGAMAFCKQSRVCGLDYINKHCPYHAQRRITHPIVYAMHQHVALHHPLMDQMRLLIGDELPLGAFLNPWTIPPASIPVEDATDDIHQLLWTLRSLTITPAPRGQGGWSGPALLAELGGAAHIAELCARHSTLRPGIDMVTPDIAAPSEVDKVDYLHLPYLLALLDQEARASLDGMPDYVRRVRVSVDGLTLSMRRRASALPEHIIWADATGDPRMYERMLGMPVDVVRPRVQMAGRIYQMWASLNNKMSLSATPTGADDEAAQGRKRQNLRIQVDQILKRGYQSPAFISYKSLISDLAGDRPHGHFGAERGTNRFEGADCLIVVGTPQPPPHAVTNMAAMLFDERMEPFRDVWSVRDVPFTGQPWAWPIGGFWDDADLQTLLEQFRDAELVQAIHRVRPLRRQVDVWLLTNAPIADLPVELVSLHQLFDAPEGVDPYRWPALRTWVAERVATVGRATAPEVAEQAGVQVAAARRYLDALASRDGYSVERAPAVGRGRPPWSLVKH